MALAIEYIIVIVLGSVLLLLIGFFVTATLFFAKKRRVLCFRQTDAIAEPFLLTDKQLETAYPREFVRKPKKITRPFSRSKKRARYERITGDPSKKDPFVGRTLENPMIDDEELDMDWTNPAFDAERSHFFDTAVIIQSWYRMVRARISYLELKEAVIAVQAFYRGYNVRKMLPQLRREKQQRDQLKRKQAGWRKKGTLSALKFFDVKGYGFAEVEQLYGLETIRNAADQLKKLYGGKGKMRLKLFISIKGIKLFEYSTMSHFATVKVSSVSFCTLDPKNKRIFAFINRKKKRNFCHVFHCHEQDAQKMVETMAEAFEVTFKKMEEKREQKQLQRETRLSKLRKQAVFQKQTRELDEEVSSMMDMAETASLDASKQILHIAELHPASEGDGSSHGSTSALASSREQLAPGRRSRSGTSTGSQSSLPQRPSRSSSGSVGESKDLTQSSSQPTSAGKRGPIQSHSGTGIKRDPSGSVQESSHPARAAAQRSGQTHSGIRKEPSNPTRESKQSVQVRGQSRSGPIAGGTGPGNPIQEYSRPTRADTRDSGRSHSEMGGRGKPSNPNEEGIRDSHSGTELGLVVPQRVPGEPVQSTGQQAREEASANDLTGELDSYLSDIKKGMDDMAQALEHESRRARREASRQKKSHRSAQRKYGN